MIPTTRPETLNILLVEDNPDDVELTREALKDSKLAINLTVANTAEDALDLLRAGAAGDSQRPDLILLDINLPGMSGLDLLEALKEDARLEDIPVVMLTTSKADEDVLRSYRLHAACYITKPLDFQQFTKVVRSIEDFWFTIVTLPSPERRAHQDQA